MTKLLVAAQTISELDRAALAVYCQAWSDYTLLTRVVREEGHVITERGVAKRNPAVMALTDARTALISAAVKLGLTPADRARLLSRVKAPKTDPDEEFFGG